MFDRRRFLIAGIASASFGFAGRAMAHKKGEPYVLPEEDQPREVKLKTKLPAGEIHVDPDQFALFWTLPGNRAIRYTVGIGRGNLYRAGVFHVGREKKWPRWIPTGGMMERRPEACKDFREGGRSASGQPGGLGHPPGARALYLYSATGRGTCLRIHGTNDPGTVGIPVPNGCARLINPHIEQPYELVPLNTRVVLYKRAGVGSAHSTIPGTEFDRQS